ncbi:MAG: urease accessory protein UreF [Lachnospiraceae bacterium]|nr:urease accessory protein UreF [Lachnospiraceae bacterium]
MNRQEEFLLLQVNDALFPIGGYSHSYGLETYIQKDLVRDEATAVEYLTHYLRYSMLHNNLLTVRLAYEYAKAQDLQKLENLEELIQASVSPREIREAGRKLGSRFIKTLAALEIEYASPIFSDYVNQQKDKSISHACAYGVFCSSIGIHETRMLENYIYAQTSVMVTNCVKSIPLSQTSGQKMLHACFPVFEELLDQVEKLDENWLFASTPGFDVRCMQHEDLYSRIYMS